MAEETRMKHFSHKHMLELNNEAGYCRMCKQDIPDDPIYYCPVGCLFTIHKSCSSIVRESIQQHPFHPQHSLFLSDDVHPHALCNACGCHSVNMLAYICFDCSFTLHVACASLIPNKIIQGQIQQQPNHPHPLILCDLIKNNKSKNKNKYKIEYKNNYTYTCSCCSLPFDDGRSVVYVCLECNGLLHETCAELPRKIEHPFHPSHPLILLPQNPRFFGYSCGACSRISDGFTYHCSECEFYLDIPCASLNPNPNPTENNELLGQEEDHRIQRFSHSHPLTLCDNKHKFPISCYACELPLGVSVCFCPECKVLLHKSCADLPQEMKHMFHPSHALTLRYHRYGKCQVCLRYSNGFFYECSRCEWCMDVRCALSKPHTMMSKIHPHPLALFNKANYEILCSTCRQLCLTPFFRCVLCHFNLHVHCISILPPTLKYNNHVHTLILTDSPIKDYPDEDDDAEFYCDACEERRELAQRSYYCEDCHYVAHPHCMVSEIMHILEEEWSEQESDGVAEQVEEPPSLTLKEFLDSFKGDENKEVQGVFEAHRRDNLGGNNGDNPKDSLHLDKASTQIMKMLVSKNQAVAMPWENWNSTSKLIKVDNYMILENLAPILGTLFGKYGDFSGTSNLSPKAKMLYIMTVCDAVNSMWSTEATDITTNLLLTWFHCFMLGQYAGFEIQFVFGYLATVVRSHFGLQADVPTDLTLAKLDEEIAEQRAVVDSKEMVASEQDREIDKLRERIAFMQLNSTEVHKKIAELRKKIKTLEEKKHVISRLTEECLSDDILELEGQTASMGLL